MSTAPPQAKSTVVVMLGGSTYPLNPSFDNPRFKRSAEALRMYFEDPAGFGLPSGNLLWLFDSGDGPIQLNDQIESFLKTAKQRPESEQPLDVIVYFIGHGFFDDSRAYHLATPSFKPGAPEYSYRFRLLQRTVKDQMRFARKYYLLDACYSASVVREMMSAEPIVRRLLNDIDADAREDAPERGTAVLCAASSDVEALAPTAEQSTMFSGALLSVLRETDFPLTLRQVHGLVLERIQRRFGPNAVRPEIHVPEQKQGDVGVIPLFPPRRAAADLSGLFDALDPATFVDESLLHAVVVCRRGADREAMPPLLQAVSDAWVNFRSEITATVDLCRAGWRAPPISTTPDSDGFGLAHLAIERIFESDETLLHAMGALCRAEIAVFDLTGWDPVATFLLGIRAVARRGVTITSVGGDFTVGSALAVPFNLQLLNLTAHSKGQEKEGLGKRPFELIGGKIVNGFRELASLPHYLDLPAYDSVRQLGVESGAYRPVQMRERILVLCPFGPDYTSGSWDRLEKLLPSQVQAHVQKAEGRKVEKPALVRLLDLKTPRLVAQTLFESIRLTDMCVVDWTDLRPNVIFEAGVRMATNPLGAVHVIEHGALAALRASHANAQVRDMLRFFDPVAYRLSGRDTSPFDQMVQRFEVSLEANGRGESNRIYAAVGAAIDRRSQPAALPLVSELTRSANLLDPEDQESTGISPVLYHEVNRELIADAREAAADRRLAAWLFMSRRYTPAEIAGDTALMESFELLSSQVRRWARRAKRTDLVNEISAGTKSVQDAGAPGKDGV